MGLTREILDGLEQCLHAHAGFDLPEWVVESRALARMSALDLGAREYLDLVRAPRGASELAALVEAVRVGETRFFRHRPQVDALLDVVVPAWRERGQRSPRAWSAGCATGEEAYTLALVLGRALPRPSFTPTILGTDVSAEALAAARRGVYPAQVIEGVPERFRDGLVIDGDVARVRADIAALVTFEQQNLADAELPRGFDLVWCRNVLIYFGPEARRRVLEKLVLSLNPGGFLFVGYSETLRDVAGLRAIRHGGQVLWQKESGPAPARLARPPQSTSPAPAPRPAPATPARRAAPATPASRSVFNPSSARAAASPGAPSRTGTLRITTSDPTALAAEIRAALRAPGLGMLTLDFDAAEYLDDEVVPVLRRALAAAEAAGIELVLRAARPGPHRWLRRHGLAGGDG